MCVECVTNELKIVIDECKIEHIVWAWVSDRKSRYLQIIYTCEV